MRPQDVLIFAQSAKSIQSMADKVSTALFIEGTTRASQLVSYSSESTGDFTATALNIPLVARLEYFKFMYQGRSTLAGRYSFFRVDIDKEHRLDAALRIIPPEDVVLPDGYIVKIDDLESHTSFALELRDKLSVALLSELVDKMEEWSFN